MFGFERVRDVLEENEPQHDVLVVAGFHVAAQLVGGLEEFGLESEARAIAGGGAFFGHGVLWTFCREAGDQGCVSGMKRKTSPLMQ